MRKRGRATRAWSGNSQWLPSLGVDGSFAGCSPQSYHQQFRSQNLAAHAISCQYAGYRASGRLPSGRKTGAYAKVFPIVRKLMHEDQPRKSDGLPRLPVHEPQVMRIAARR